MKVPLLLHTPIYTHRAVIKEVMTPQHTNLPTPNLAINSYLASMIERTDSQESGGYSRHPTAIIKSIYRENPRVGPISRGAHSTQRTRNPELAKISKVIMTSRFDVFQQEMLRARQINKV
jgi:hypothetical protein